MYDIGDVLYVISNKSRNIVPVQVTQQIVSKTLNLGEQTTYMVTLPLKPGHKKPRSVDLENISGTVYESIEAAQEELLEQARLAIEDVVARAKQVKDDNFLNLEDSEDHAAIEEESPHAQEIFEEFEVIDGRTPENGDVVVQMPDGSTAKLNVEELHKTSSVTPAQAR